MKFADRFSLATECAMVMFACSAGPGAFEVWRHGAENSGGYLLVVGVPAMAALLFVGVASVLPGMLAVGGLKFPLQITLPIVFGSLLLTLATLWTTSPFGIVRNVDVVRFGRLWTQPGAIAVSMVAGAAALAMLSLLRGDASVESA